eukprot:3220695-Amphidinium_carterae.2
MHLPIQPLQASNRASHLWDGESLTALVGSLSNISRTQIYAGFHSQHSQGYRRKGLVHTSLIPGSDAELPK